MRAVDGSKAVLALALTTTLAGPGLAGEEKTTTAADRGRAVMTTEPSRLKASWTRDAYSKVGALWGPGSPDPEKDPAAFADRFQRRYGLHPAPYPNDGLPMGLRRAPSRDGNGFGFTVDCMICHGGSIGGTGYVGLGNTQLDMDAMVRELVVADGKAPPPVLFNLGSVRGSNNAGMAAAILLSLRNPDLSRRAFPLLLGANLPEMDTPAWWLLRKKTTKYYDGRTAADDHRANMQFYLGEFSRKDFEAYEPAFRETEDFFRSLEPPKYPFAIDAPKADRGRAVFERNCAKCHGTYGPDETYPNEIVPLAKIGTDPARARGISDRLVSHYNTTWFADLKKVDPTMIGYQAPPLDGLWATAPYLHNGSVPTLHALLNSPERPSKFLRPVWTGFDEYDTTLVGWKSDPVPSDLKAAGVDPKRVYDTTRWGFGKSGHTFGDKLAEEQRMDLIEYLKTL